MKLLRILAVLIACSCLSIHTVSAQSTPAIKFREGSVWITGLNAERTELVSVSQQQWATVLRVYTNDAFVKKLDQSIAGNFTWRRDSLFFKPHFSFSAGQQYHAVFDYEAFRVMSGSKPTGNTHTFELAFAIPKEVLISTFVELVHPEAEVLPENMLRMHILFSHAMMPGEAYEHITLLKEDGTPVEKAFLVIDQELWDAERKRFTVLFDPGRIKRGIQAQSDLGTPLQAGQTYRLIIDSLWRDANENVLAGSYTKSFTVTSAQRSRNNIQAWKVITPAAGTSKDLFIEFDRPMDYILVSKYLTIVSACGQRVKGKTTFKGSRYWYFTPDESWMEGTYYIEVNPFMEDVAGNNFDNVFDIDLTNESRRHTPEMVRQSFQVKPLLK